MYDKAEICDKIKSIYPDIGECGIDVKVDYDKDQDSLVVYLRKDNKEVKHYLPNEDADACLLGQQCVALGVEIAQLRD
jgi:uncharacterized protein (UPF0335 family)